MKRFSLSKKNIFLFIVRHNFPEIVIKIIFIKANAIIFPNKYATFIKSEQIYPIPEKA